MDGGSSSLPLSPPPPQVYLRRPMPPPDPAGAPKVHFFRPPAPIPIFTSRGPGPRGAPKPPMPPTPAPVAVQAPPPPPGPAANQQLQPRPAQPPLAAGAMRPPRPLQPPSAAGAMLPPPAPQSVGQQRAAPRSNDESNGKEISRAEVKKEEIVQGHDDKASTTAPVKVVKRTKNLKAFKHTLDASNGGTIEGDAGPLYSSNHCRYDSSLSLLTKKFISLLQEAEDGTLDLNKAAETLEVQKRRIYDITNVLEGVDLIEKTLKNMIRWKGFVMSKPKEKECQISALKRELESLYEEDHRLENEIRETQDKLDALTLDKDKRKLLYVLKDDINKIPHFQESTLIAINAPRGTSIEVPDPNADFYLLKDLGLTELHYKMVLRSSMGRIYCYLISDSPETFNPYPQVTLDNSEPAMETRSAQALQHMDCDPNQSVQPLDSDPNKSLRQMDCDPNEVVQQMDCDQNQAPKKGERNAAHTYTAAASIKHKSMTDILRIVPSDADADSDYWFASEPDVSVTDTWGS